MVLCLHLNNYVYYINVLINLWYKRKYKYWSIILDSVSLVSLQCFTWKVCIYFKVSYLFKNFPYNKSKVLLNYDLQANKHLQTLSWIYHLALSKKIVFFLSNTLSMTIIAFVSFHESILLYAIRYLIPRGTGQDNLVEMISNSEYTFHLYSRRKWIAINFTIVCNIMKSFLGLSFFLLS